MPAIDIRLMTESDVGPVSALFAATLGEGFWELDLDEPGCHVVALADGAVVGAASAALMDVLDEHGSLPGPVGLVRLVAVRPDMRKAGVGRRLVEEAVEGCRDLGVASLAAFAWVYGRSGECPLAGLLSRLGFTKTARFDGFYAEPTSQDGAEPDGPYCPQCSTRPCSCSADLYVRVLRVAQ